MIQTHNHWLAPIHHMTDTNQQTNASITTGKDNCLIGSPTSTFSISQLRVGIGPILATIGLGFLVLIPGAFANGWLAHLLGMERSMAMPWLAHYVDHGVMVLIALALIAWLSKGHFSEYGLQRPKGKSYVLAAIAWGTFFGILMTVVDYLPQILARTPPPDNLLLSRASVAGWLGFECVFVGFCEEIPFRGLLQTFLMQRTSGCIRLGKFDMHIAGVILAMLFALAHITNFWQRPFWFALAQQVYAFALGILYAYWREKSGSLLASIIGHNLSDGVEYALMFLLTWLWR
jgi:membrane protease YdiL (CAAX protease family)